jgi:diacylglycerol kinase (ATP)
VAGRKRGDGVSEAPLLVVNPHSGGGNTGKVFPELKTTIERVLGKCDVVFTEAPGHAIELARNAVKDARSLIVAIGGDGTIHEVVNGVMSANAQHATRIGVIGQGTGGDFRRTLGLEHRLDRYLESITSGRTRKVDVGRISFRARDGKRGERYFVNIASCGMGGLVDRYVADASRLLGGTVAYFGASLRALATIRVGQLKCTITDANGTREEKIRSYMFAICNGRYFGSGMHVAPMADTSDGHFEVVSIDAPSKLGFALTSQAIYTGGHIGKSGVVHFRCSKIAIDLHNEDARDVFLLDVDGEQLGGLPIEIEMLPQVVTFAA